MKTSNGSQTRERQAVIGPPLAPGHLSILYTVYTAISDWLASRNTQVTSQRNETLRAVCTFSLFLNCLFFRKALVFVLGFSCFGKNFSPKAIGYYVTSFPLFLETPGKMDTSFGCSDFWHLLVGQALVMIG